VDLAGVEVVTLQADDLAPAQAGVGDGDEHRELLAAAGQEGGPFGEEEGLQRGGPGALRGALQPAAGAAAAVAGP
jgi:hypothetical protein